MSRNVAVFVDFQSILRNSDGLYNSLSFLFEITSNYGTNDFNKVPSGVEADYFAVFDRLSHIEKEKVLPSYKAKLKVTFLEDYLNEQCKLNELLPLCGFTILSSSLYESSDVIFSEVTRLLLEGKYKRIVVITGDLNLLQVLNLSKSVETVYFNNLLFFKPQNTSIRDFAYIIPYYLAIKGYNYYQIDGFNLQSESRCIDMAILAFNCYKQGKGGEFAKKLFELCSYKNVTADDIQKKVERNLRITKLYSNIPESNIKIRKPTPLLDDFCLLFNNMYYSQEVAKTEPIKCRELFSFFSGRNV